MVLLLLLLTLRDGSSYVFAEALTVVGLLVRIISVLEKAAKNRTVKQSMVSANFSDFWAYSVDFWQL